MKSDLAPYVLNDFLNINDLNKFNFNDKIVSIATEGIFVYSYNKTYA